MTTICFQTNRHVSGILAAMQRPADDHVHQRQLQHSLAPDAVDGRLHGGWSNNFFLFIFFF